MDASQQAGAATFSAAFFVLLLLNVWELKIIGYQLYIPIAISCAGECAHVYFRHSVKPTDTVHFVRPRDINPFIWQCGAWLLHAEQLSGRSVTQTTLPCGEL